MTPDQAASSTKSAPVWWSLSFLAPLAVVILPLFALAFASGEKNEAYEWTQHAVAGVGFASAFFAVFLSGHWKKNWVTAVAGSAALIAVMAVIKSGVPSAHILFAVAGGMVATGYWFARRLLGVSLGEVVAVGVSSMFSFWAVSRLSWWKAFDLTLADGSNKLWLVGVSAFLIVMLVSRERETGDSRITARWLSCGIDVVILGLLTAYVFCTTTMKGDMAFPFHWGVYVSSANMVRAGHVMLGTVPSQYGFLSTLLLAALPTDDGYTAVYWLQGVTVWISGAIIYFTLKTWLSRWWWQLGAGLITVVTVCFLCGDASLLSGAIIYPSVGGMRFIWVHVLLGFLIWQYRRHKIVSALNLSVTLWTGSFIWLLGVLWSVESAVYVTAAWFPAASLLAMRTGPMVGKIARIRALIGGIGRTVFATGALLATTVAVIAAYYHFALSRSPEWSGYWEYATAFSSGFGSLPIESTGGIWVLVLLHAALLASIISIEVDEDPFSASLIWAGWGAFWAVSTYYIARSHINNITNLGPVLLLIIGLMVNVSRATRENSLARLWTWLVVPPLVGGMLWLVVTNNPNFRLRISNYSIEPQVARLLPPADPALMELIKSCQEINPGPYSILGHLVSEVVRPEADQAHLDLLPLLSMALFEPLPQERREFYLDAYNARPTAGWLITPTTRYADDEAWFFNYANSRYVVRLRWTPKTGQGGSLSPNPKHDPEHVQETTSA